MCVFFKIFIYLFDCAWSPLLSGGFSLVAGQVLLTAVASLVAEHEF